MTTNNHFDFDRATRAELDQQVKSVLARRHDPSTTLSARFLANRAVDYIWMWVLTQEDNKAWAAQERARRA